MVLNPIEKPTCLQVGFLMKSVEQYQIKNFLCTDSLAGRLQPRKSKSPPTMSKVTNGDIILMHDLYSNTLEAVKIVLPLLKEQGYEFVTVSELLGEDLAPGYKYSNAY